MASMFSIIWIERISLGSNYTLIVSLLWINFMNKWKFLHSLVLPKVISFPLPIIQIKHFLIIYHLKFFQIIVMMSFSASNYSRKIFIIVNITIFDYLNPYIFNKIWLGKNFQTLFAKKWIGISSFLIPSPSLHFTDISYRKLSSV